VKAVVTCLIDGTVVDDIHEGDRITTKIFKDGRGNVTVDGDAISYRRVERITLFREGKTTALTTRETA
jgi:hypothetical protein